MSTIQKKPEIEKYIQQKIEDDGINFPSVFRKGVYAGIAYTGAESGSPKWVKAESESNSTKWLEILKEISPFIDELINKTPTGERRNYLTDIKIKLKSAILNNENITI